MRGYAQHIIVGGSQFIIELTEALGRVNMIKDIQTLQGFADLMDGLDNAGFAVDVHHGNQQRVFINQIQNLARPDSTRLIRSDIIDLAAMLFHILHGFQNRFMLYRGRDQMVLSRLSGIIQ